MKRPYGNEGEGQYTGKNGEPTRPKHAGKRLPRIGRRNRRSKGNVFWAWRLTSMSKTFSRRFPGSESLASSEPRVLAVGAFPRVGQTAQFQIRDRMGASEELELLVARRGRIEGQAVFGACSGCSGEAPGCLGDCHDSKAVYTLLQPQGMVGFFGNGEFGPVGAGTSCMGIRLR